VVVVAAMTNTSSRILRQDELSTVAPVWWQDANATRIIQGKVSKEPAAGESEHDWQREAAEQAAYQRGMSEGKAIGGESVKGEVLVVLERLTRSLAELSTLRSRLRKNAEADMVKLSIAVARRVLHRELTLDPESIDGLIRVALDKLDSHELSRVRVHPDQEHAVRSAMTRFTGARNVEVVADAALQCGDVLFETTQGVLDASVEAQLREIERGFADRLRR
jgi:flagellar assembly protein FliH